MNLQVSGARSFRREGGYKWGSTRRHTSANGLSYGYCANKRSARPIIDYPLHLRYGLPGPRDLSWPYTYESEP